MKPLSEIERAVMAAKGVSQSGAQPYLPDSNPDVGISSLKKHFDEALAHHHSLDPKAKRLNSKWAKARVAEQNGGGYLLAQNGKLLKTETGVDGSEPVQLPDGRGVEATGLSLAPAFQYGKLNTCPNHAPCKDSCLGKTADGNFRFGGGKDLNAIKGPRLAHLKNTMAMVLDPKAFITRVSDEITAAKKKSAANGNKLGVRLNVLSDIHPKAYESLIKSHPDVDFYDYTKLASNPVAPNHHLTYSSTGVTQPAGINGNSVHVHNPHQNWRRMRSRLESGSNVAMAFTHKSYLPEHVYDHETGNHYRVVNGDDHDFRPLDKQPSGSKGVIVGLKNKKNIGKKSDAHIDSHGFFVHYDPKLAKGVDGKPIPTNKTVEIAVQPHEKTMRDNDGHPEAP